MADWDPRACDCWLRSCNELWLLPACLARSGWYEFTHTASQFNITATDRNLGNITGAADSAFAAIKDTRTTLLAAGNPSLKVLGSRSAGLSQLICGNISLSLLGCRAEPLASDGSSSVPWRLIPRLG